MNPGATSAVRLIVFDWDGTLVDSTGAISGAMQRAAADLGLEVPNDRLASHVIGLGVEDALRLAVPDLRMDQRPRFMERYRQHFIAIGSSVCAFPGVESLLSDLRASGTLLAVATGKSRLGLERAFEQTGWRRHFDASRCADEGEPKPHPWMLADLLDELSVAPHEAVMVGDTSHDLQMARAAGCPAIAVSYGAHPRDHLDAQRPLALVDDVPGLRCALFGLLGQGGASRLRVCQSSALVDGGDGVRFDLPPEPGGSEGPLPAFAIRFQGQPYAYVNQCAHVAVELDWQPGRFFDETRRYLICATHGATYRAEDGVCVAGPCRGRSLRRLECEERDGYVWARPV